MQYPKFLVLFFQFLFWFVKNTTPKLQQYFGRRSISKMQFCHVRLDPVIDLNFAAHVWCVMCCRTRFVSAEKCATENVQTRMYMFSVSISLNNQHFMDTFILISMQGCKYDNNYGTKSRFSLLQMNFIKKPNLWSKLCRQKILNWKTKHRRIQNILIM